MNLISFTYDTENKDENNKYVQIRSYIWHVKAFTAWKSIHYGKGGSTLFECPSKDKPLRTSKNEQYTFIVS